MLDLWIERYRPQNIEDFVWASPNLKSKVDEWIAAGQTPNVLFSGGAGRGKTTLARMLMKALGIPKGDILDINATLERKVDALTDSITGFTSSWAMGPSGIKYVILDEADRLTPLTQDFLRGEIEKHHETVRFILTGNNRRKFTEPLLSRLQEFEFSALRLDEATMRAANVLVAENVTFEPETLIRYVEAYHPDLRKCINVLQQRTVGGVLQNFDTEAATENDQAINILAHLVSGNSTGARALMSETSPEDYVSLLRFIFTNIEVFDGVDNQDRILLAVRDGLWRHSTVADTEINMAATLTEIARIARNVA